MAHGFVMPPEMYLEPEWAERFCAKVDKNGPTVRPELGPCWVWTAYKNRTGYGQMGVGAGTKLAHRLSFELHFGPPQYDVCHECDNPTCVRPEHLYDAPALKNMQDAKARGRLPYGARNGSALLDDARVVEIRAKYATGTSQLTLAREYSVSRSALADIVCGRTWRHLPGALPEGWASRVSNKGVKHPAAKLTERNVLEIREQYTQGRSQYDIADEFGVSQTAVWAILRRRTWKHV